MENETKPTNFNLAVPRPPGLSDANFVPTPPTLSGIPLPEFKKQKSKIWLILVVVMLGLLGAGFYFYQKINSSPEILLVRSLNLLRQSQTLSYQGDLTVTISNDPAAPDALPALAASSTTLSINHAVKINAKYNYLSDITDPANPKLQYEFNYLTDIPNYFANYNGQVKILALKNEYDILASDTLVSTALNAPALAGRWLVIPRAAQAKSVLPQPDTSSSTEAWLQAVTLYLTQQQLKSYADFSQLSQENINNVGCYLIHFHLSQGQLDYLTGHLRSTGKITEESYNQMAMFYQTFREMDFDLWVNKKTIAPAKISLSADFTNSRQQNIKLDLVLNNIVLNQDVAFAQVESPLSADAAVKLSKELSDKSDQENLQGFQYLNLNQNMLARPLLEQAIADNPNNFHAYNSLGLVYSQNQDYASAINYYNQALAINPAHDKAAINLIDALYSKKDYPAVIAAANKFFLAYPQSTFLREAHWDLANAYALTRQYDLSVAQWQIVIQTDPASLDNYEAYDEMGLSYFQLGQYGKAADSYRQSISWLLKDPKGNRETVAVVYQDLASAYIRLKQFNDATNAMSSALKYNPKLKDDSVYQSELKTLEMARNNPNLFP